MATTGELRAIIEELQLIDAGDAASYLGEEVFAAEEISIVSLQEGISGASIAFYTNRFGKPGAFNTEMTQE